jgi:hypothetical protein
LSARKLATAALACGSVGICLLCAPAGAQQTAADPLKSGIARVEAGDFRMGIMTLNEVIDPDSTASASDQARAHAYRAQAYLGLNEPERARAALLLALKADASVKVTAPPFSLALVNLFEAVTAPADANHEATAAAAAAAGNYQQAFVHYLSAYEALPDAAPTADDRRLRERIIDVVRRLNTRPAIPAEAAAHFDKATQLLEAEAVLGAGGTATAEAAATELQRAIRIAPWWPEATFKLAGLEQKLQRVDAALINLNLYKRADPEGYAAATAPKTALPREAAAPRLASRPATAVIPPATAIRARSGTVRSGTPTRRGGWAMTSGSGGSRSKATDAVISMNSSSHRIWIGRSGWPKPTSVAVRTKPSRATWVDVRNTRPF